MSFLNRNDFDELSAKFLHLLYERTEGDRNLINKTLDELNSMNYRYPMVKNSTKAVLLINTCCSLIPPDDSQLVPKCCKLISNLVNMQKVVVEGKTLTMCFDWIIETLRQCPESVITESLVALHAMLINHKHNLQLLLPLALCQSGPLLKLSTTGTLPEVVLYSVMCLESCTEIPPTKNSKQQLQDCMQIFISHLTAAKLRASMDEIYYCKVLISCLNGLRNVVLEDQEYLKQEIGFLLGIAKSYMTYGIKGIDFITPQRLMPTILGIPEPSTNPSKEKRGGKVAKHRRQRITTVKQNNAELQEDARFCSHYTSVLLEENELPAPSSNSHKLRTSDSDFSDSDSGKLAQLSAAQGRLRQAALNFFFNLVKRSEKRTIFAYWCNFISDGNPSFGAHSLTTCILKDPSPKGRIAAVNVLLRLLTSLKLYLSQAEYSEKTTAFTPFSVTLGYMLKELHRCLSLALNENSVPVLLQVLKCIVGLVQATPYHRLSTGLITKIVRNVKIYVYHRDQTVQAAALIIIGCILTIEPVLPEAKTAFLRSRMESKKTEANASNATGRDDFRAEDVEFAGFSSDEDDANASSTSGEMPWILEKCLQNLGKDVPEERENPAVTPLKTESLQILCAMSRNYVAILMAPHLADVARVLNRSLLDKSVSLYAGRAIDFIGQAIDTYFTNNVTEKAISLPQALTFWQLLINDPLISLLENEQESSFRGVGCDSLGSIGAEVFAHLLKDKQILIVTLLFARSRDENGYVTGAAVRALGMCAIYPTMREDEGFLADVADAVLRASRSANLSVRVKASWALGNLSNAFVQNKNSGSDSEEIPRSLLLQLLEISNKLGAENESVKCNAVRAIGYLLQLVSPEHMKDAKFKRAVEQCIQTLMANCFKSSFMKVKWNSCYAIGNILKNSDLFLGRDAWQESIYNTLIELVMNNRNFKVRINAALALAAPSAKEIYGNYYQTVWKSLLKALENSQNMEDLSEYKHRDNLVEQICFSLGHLATLLTVSDLSLLKECLHLNTDLLVTHMQRVLERVLPERTDRLFAAVEHLQSLTPETKEQQATVSLLLKIFDNRL